MPAYATTSDRDDVRERLSIATANENALNSALSSVSAKQVSIASNLAYLDAKYTTWKTFCDSLIANLALQRTAVDLAVSKLETSVASLASTVTPGNKSGYAAAITALGELRDKCTAWYDAYTSTATEISDLEDDKVIKHLLTSWDSVHGNMRSYLTTYRDSNGDVVGDHAIKWTVSGNTTTYNWTSADVAAGCTATTLYTPAISATNTLHVTGATVYERSVSPYIVGNTTLLWVLYMPPEVRNGVFKKYTFMANGSTGSHRWQYQNKDGNWVTLAELSLDVGTNFYAPYKSTATLELSAYSGTGSAKVDVTISCIRTTYGGYMRIEPTGPNYPENDIMFYGKVRCLILNTETIASHRYIVSTLEGREAYASVGNVVYVIENGAQYTYTNLGWTDTSDSEVDTVVFNGFGIVRHQCVYT